MIKAIPLKAFKRPGESGYSRCEPEEATHIGLHFPGPLPNRIIPVRPQEDGPSWSWNKSIDSPTISPSIKTWDNTHTCHSFVRGGVVEFCGDCTHELAGQKAELLDATEVWG